MQDQSPRAYRDVRAALAAIAPAGMLRAYVLLVRTTPALVALTLLAIFLPVVIVPYAYSDDYSLLWMAVSGEPSAQFGESVFFAHALGGRPLSGLLTTLFFSAAGTIENLRFVRLFALASIIALALLMQWALVRSGIRRTPSALITVFVCSMPAFQVGASWAVLFSVPLAALLGGGASALATVESLNPRHRIVLPLGATAMLLAALTIYQPSAMFFWVFLAIALVGCRDEPRLALRTTLRHFGVGAGALAIAFLVTRLFVRYFSDTATAGHRSALAQDIVGKARWFFEQPLYTALNLFDLTPSPSLAAAVASIAVGGTLLWLLQRSPRPLLYVVVGAALIPLSYLPSLVIVENSNYYRTHFALTSLIALYFCLGVLGAGIITDEWLRLRVGRVTRQVVERVALVIAVLVVGGIAFGAATTVTTLIVDPQMTELRMVRSQVAALPRGVTRVAFVQTPSHLAMAPRVIGHEFGLPTTNSVWTLEPLMLLLLREEQQLPPVAPRPSIDVFRWDTTTFPPGEPLIDVRGLWRFR